MSSVDGGSLSASPGGVSSSILDPSSFVASSILVPSSSFVASSLEGSSLGGSTFGFGLVTIGLQNESRFYGMGNDILNSEGHQLTEVTGYTVIDHHTT